MLQIEIMVSIVLILIGCIILGALNFIAYLCYIYGDTTEALVFGCIAILADVLLVLAYIYVDGR